MSKLRTVANTVLTAITFDLAYTLWRIRNEVIRLQKKRWEDTCNHSNSPD